MKIIGQARNILLHILDMGLDKNTLRDGNSTVLYAVVDIVDTVYTVNTVGLVYIVDMVYTVDTVHLVYIVDTVDLVCTVDTVDMVYTDDTVYILLRLTWFTL